MKPNRQKIPITKDWKDIEGWEGYYMVSNKGQVMSLERTQLRTMPDGTKRRMGYSPMQQEWRTEYGKEKQGA